MKQQEIASLLLQGRNARGQERALTVIGRAHKTITESLGISSSSFDDERMAEAEELIVEAMDGRLDIEQAAASLLKLAKK